MIFSSNVFIFMFLPIALLVYYIVLKNKLSYRNVFLFFVSLFFYAWGEPVYILLMLLSIGVNYIFGIVISSESVNTNKKTKLFIGVIINVFIIFVFKYLDFVIVTINAIVGVKIPLLGLTLPIGISFYTFQGISYLIDVYRDGDSVQKSFLNVGLYIAFFPQLIAGPIVRYCQIQAQFKKREHTIEKFSEGVRRFVYGLAKKVFLANNLALVADYAFTLLKAYQLSVSMAWLGAVAYTLQIYFDFSGYSDMAIGLGKMFGFELPENFNYPYIAKSISEFWRRWHMTLQGWYKDYIYIPLGGSRVSPKRHVLNLLIVWFLTGLWHGANWTFVVWGLMYFVLLIIEKRLKLAEKSTFLMYIYVMFFVIIGWVIFRADSLRQAFEYIKIMCGLGNSSIVDTNALLYLKEHIFFFVLGIIASMPVLPAIKKRCTEHVWQLMNNVLLIASWLVSLAYIVRGAYNPFIYFNF